MNSYPSPWSVPTVSLAARLKQARTQMAQDTPEMSPRKVETTAAWAARTTDDRQTFVSLYASVMGVAYDPKVHGTIDTAIQHVINRTYRQAQDQAPPLMSSYDRVEYARAAYAPIEDLWHRLIRRTTPQIQYTHHQQLCMHTGMMFQSMSRVHKLTMTYAIENELRQVAYSARRAFRAAAQVLADRDRLVIVGTEQHADFEDGTTGPVAYRVGYNAYSATGSPSAKTRMVSIEIPMVAWS